MRAFAPFAGNSLRDGLRNIGRRIAAHSSCRNATRVIAVSAFVRDFLLGEWRIPAEKVSVVAHGVEPALVPSRRLKPASVTPQSDRAMVFVAGSIRPARGLEDLLNAQVRLKGLGVEPTIVIAGSVSGDGERYRRKLKGIIARGQIGDSVVWAGSLSPHEMAWCYGNSSVFVMTSRVEACPNTALEAMSYGASCIATTNRPMPEIFGDAARYYTAGDYEMLADRIVSVFRLPDSENVRPGTEFHNGRRRGEPGARL